jgi:SNF2 family DNA or RNA helicase
MGQENAHEVGQYLNDKKVYLQEPDYWDFNFDYSNPHLLDLSCVALESQTGLEESRSSFFELDIEFQDYASDQMATPQSILKERIATAFKNMTRAHNLKRTTADIRNQTILKPYQEEALDFIMQRECGPVPEEYCLWKSKHINGELVYEHAITGCHKHDVPFETRGGIFADEMGLGKTLTMLSANI